MDDYLKARSFYEKALDTAQKALPATCSDLKKWRNNLDRVKKKF
jgi:hypothetical protein